jgi:hypothetical protein
MRTKFEGKRLIGRRRRKWEDNIEMDLGDTECGLDSTGSVWGPGVVFCEYDDGYSGSIKAGIHFLNQLSS